MRDMGIKELREQYKMEKDADIRERILMTIWLKSEKSTYQIGTYYSVPTLGWRTGRREELRQENQSGYCYTTWNP